MRPSTHVDPAELADTFALGEIEEALVEAEQAGDGEGAEHFRRAWMWSAAEEMARWERSLDRRLELLFRERIWSTWRDEGAVAWRLRVEWHDGHTARTMSWWLREGDLGYELMVDHEDALTPTPFARRTMRHLPRSQHGLKQAERLITGAIG